METIRGTIAPAARPLRDNGGLATPIRSEKDTGKDGYIQILIVFSSFGCEPYRFIHFSTEPKIHIFGSL